MGPTFVLAGHLQRDYLLPLQGRPLIDVPGGNLLYAAAGISVWEKGIGLLARVGEDYPNAWLKDFEKYGWDRAGVHVLAETLDLRYFQAILESQVVQHNNPVPHFARLGLPFPKSLIGYQPAEEAGDYHKATSPASSRPSDIPANYLDAHIVHVCPLEFLSASRLTSTFRQAKVTTLTLDPSAAYMTGGALEDVHSLVQGLTAFLPSEEELRALFWGQSNDLWQMAENLGAYGCEFIVIKRGAHGQMLYDSISRKRWEVPAYAARVADLNGAGDSFCGGFLAGYEKTYDPLQAVLHGSVSASLSIEGSGAFYSLEALPGLAQARLDLLAENVRQV